MKRRLLPALALTALLVSPPARGETAVRTAAEKEIRDEALGGRNAGYRVSILQGAQPVHAQGALLSPPSCEEIPYLEERLESKRWQVRYILKSDIAEFKSPECKTLLERFVKDPDHRVAEQSTVIYLHTCLDVDRVERPHGCQDESRILSVIRNGDKYQRRVLVGHLAVRNLRCKRYLEMLLDDSDTFVSHNATRTYLDKFTIVNKELVNPQTFLTLGAKSWGKEEEQQVFLHALGRGRYPGKRS